MSTVNRTIETDDQKTMALRLLENRPMPFTLTLTDGKHRSTAQNKLQHMWMSEIAQQKGDMTPAEVRAYCKLTIGVPLLRAENEAFREGYDRVVKPLSYEEKIALMSEPLDLPVTRLMTTKQKTQYLDAIAKHFGEQGIILTMPEDMRREIETNSNPGPETSPAAGSAPDDQPSSPAADPGVTEAPASNVSPVVGAGLPSQSQLPDQPHSDTGKEPGARPSEAASGSGSLFPKSFSFAAGELVNLQDFARKALDIAADATMSAGGKSYDIEGMEQQYRRVLASEDANQALDAMLIAIGHVKEGRRSRELASGYIARELLGCNPEDLKGRRHV